MGRLKAKGGKALPTRSKAKGSFKSGRIMKKKKERAHKVVRKNAGRLKKPTGQEIKGIKEGGEGREKERPGVGDSKCETASRKAAKVILMSKKERKSCRRRQKEDYALTTEAKSSWERLRRHQLANSERRELMEKLLSSIVGQIYQLSLKHDTARVVQCCLKYGTRSQRSAVFSELKDHIVELCKLKYAKFTVKSLLKYCTALERGHVISSLYGSVRRLVRHSEAAEVLEIAYNDYANASQRAALVKEFYGPQFSLFKDEATPATLTELLKDRPEMRESLTRHLKESILPLLEKKVVQHSIVHRVLLEFFLNCSVEERSEMIEAVKEVVVHMLHTKEGSRVAMTTLWHGTAKDRKTVLKSFKTYVTKICKEENGHLVMMALFDSVDDTVMVKKVILSEIMANLEDLCDDPFGRRVLIYLLAPRCPAHFSPQFTAVLSAGDGNTHSKKEPGLRQSELRAGIINPLLDLAEKRVCSWARNKCHAPLLLQIADSASGPSQLGAMYSSLVEGLCHEFDSSSHLVVDASAHWVIKRLLANQAKGKGLAELILDKVPVEQLMLWAGSNRGSFVLSAQVRHLEHCSQAHHKLAARLREAGSDNSEASNSLKGQQALINELDKFIKACES